MAKKQYFSPELEINALSQEDVLTASTEVNGYKHVYRAFNLGWIGGTGTSGTLDDGSDE